MSLITMDRASLANAVEFAKVATPERPVIEADGNITLSYAENKLMLFASDGIQGAKAEITVDGGTAEPFSIGCDPKRLIKILAKDSSERVTLMKTPEGINIADVDDAFNKFSTLIGANMLRASKITSWTPKNPSNSLTVPTGVLQECIDFLEEFMPEGKDENTLYDLIALDNKIAYVSNGSHMRGIFLSPDLPFTTTMTVRKKYAKMLVRGMKALGSDEVLVNDDVRVISLASPDMSKVLLLPKSRQAPSSAPIEYVMAMGDSAGMDMKEALKGLDKLSSSNYNSLTTVTGVDIRIRGEGDASTLQFVLEGNKASSTININRGSSEEIDRTIDLKGATKLLKVFSKSAGARVYFGSMADQVPILRIMQKKCHKDKSYACIVVCRYSRKIAQ